METVSMVVMYLYALYATCDLAMTPVVPIGHGDTAMEKSSAHRLVSPISEPPGITCRSSSDKHAL